MGENYKDTFHVENGVLKVDYRNHTKFNGEFGHLFWKEKLAHFHIRAKYRFTGEQTPGGPSWGFRNNGIMIFSEPPETMELDQDFPASIEVQLLGGGNPRGGQNTGAFCTPHTRAVYNGALTTKHRTSVKEKIVMGDPWVTVEVEVHGIKLITHIYDGETLISYSQPQLNPNDAHAKLLLAKGMPQMLEGGFIASKPKLTTRSFAKSRSSKSRIERPPKRAGAPFLTRETGGAASRARSNHECYGLRDIPPAGSAGVEGSEASKKIGGRS